MLTIAINTLLVIHVVVSLLIILVVLMQRPKNEGLGAAFGGGMTGDLFGAQTTNVLQKFTRLLTGAFFLLTLVLSMLYARQSNSNMQTPIERQLSGMAAPVVPPTPITPTHPLPSAGAFAPGSDSVLPLGSTTPAPAEPLTSGSAPAAAPAASATPQPAASAKPSPTASAPKDDKKH